MYSIRFYDGAKQKEVRTLRTLLPSSQPPRVALVLSGGGANGIIHLGVLKVLHEAGIPIDLVLGCSSGSWIGALYCRYRSPSKLYQIAKELTQLGASYRIFGMPSLLSVFQGKGIFSLHNLRKLLHELLGESQFHELAIPLGVATTNLTQGHLTCFTQGPLVESLCASASIPAVFEPVSIDGQCYVDGGVVSPLPVWVARKFAPQVVIAVNVLKAFQKGTGGSGLLRTYLLLTNARLQQEKQLADIVIDPGVELKGIGTLFSPGSHFTALYRAGIESGKAALPAIQAFLEAHHIPLVERLSATRPVRRPAAIRPVAA